MTSDKAGLFARLASRLRYPHLFIAVLVLFGIDLAIPDALPFIDEALLGFVTVLLAAWRRRKEERLAAGEERDALPPASSDQDEA